MLKVRQSIVGSDSATDVHAIKHKLTRFRSIRANFLSTSLMLVVEWGSGGLNAPPLSAPVAQSKPENLAFSHMIPLVYQSLGLSFHSPSY